MKTDIAIWHMRHDAEAGRLLERIVFDRIPASLDAATQQLPGGAYTTFRTYGRFQVLNLEDHINRLIETAVLAGRPVALDRSAIKTALHQAFSDYPAEVKRVRLILDLSMDTGMYILVESLEVPSEEDYRCGVRIITRPMQRENPKAKLTRFIDTAATMRQVLPKGIHEVVMVGRDQRALEGLSSNFFAVKDGVIWTANEGVLSGITRQTVLGIIQALELSIKMSGVLADALSSLDEAFLTSTSRAVLPIREIDGQGVGDGRPGVITRRLMAAYEEEITHHIETV